MPADIKKIYREELGRDLDKSGAKTYADFSEDQIRAAIRNSEEYAKYRGGSKGSPQNTKSGGSKSSGQRYTPESFREEFRKTRGFDPSDRETKVWVSSKNVGVGDYTKEFNYTSKNTEVMHLDKDGKPITGADAGQKASRIFVVHKNQKAFEEYYGDKKPGGDDNVIHLAPTESLKALGEYKHLSDPKAIKGDKDDKGLSDYLKSIGISDPTGYSYSSVLHPSGNFLHGDIFDKVVDITGIEEVSEIGEKMFSWMPGELKFAIDPLGTYGNQLDDSWNADSMEAMADVFNTDIEKMYQIQGVANMALDLGAMVATGGAASGAIAAKNVARAANQVAGRETTSSQFFLTAGTSAASAAIGGMGMGSTTTVLAQQGAQVGLRMALGKEDFGTALKEQAWSYAGGLTGGLATVGRVAVDEEYKSMLEDQGALGWASLALSAGSQYFNARTESKQKGGYLNFLKSEVGMEPVNAQAVRESQASALTRDGVLSPVKPSDNYGFNFSAIPSRTVPGEFGSTQTGWDAFKSNSADLMRAGVDNVKNAMSMGTPLMLVRGPAFQQGWGQDRWNKQQNRRQGEAYMRQMRQPKVDPSLSLAVGSVSKYQTRDNPEGLNPRYAKPAQLNRFSRSSSPAEFNFNTYAPGRPADRGSLNVKK